MYPVLLYIRKVGLFKRVAQRYVTLKLQLVKIVPGLGMIAKLAYDLHRRAHGMAY